jgi:Protein of unknown function (DUF3455)
MRPALTCTILALLIAPLQAAELPDAIGAPGDTLVTTVHAVGSQIYECEFDTVGNLVWQFREPIAVLFVSGKTIGRHYAGPTWELIDGSVVSGKVISSAPPASPADIPILNLEVTSRRGQGQLSIVSTIQRLNTHGGVAVAECSTQHTLLGAPYTADYAFYRKSGPTHAGATHAGATHAAMGE